jgi:hypothetical protein
MVTLAVNPEPVTPNETAEEATPKHVVKVAEGSFIINDEDGDEDGDEEIEGVNVKFRFDKKELFRVVFTSLKVASVPKFEM